MGKNVDLIFELKKLELKKGDLIVVKVPKNSPLHEKVNMSSISKLMTQFKATAIIISDDIDIEKLDSKTMEKLGWVRKGKDENS